MSRATRKEKREQRREDRRLRHEMGADFENALRIVGDLKDDDPVGFAAMSHREIAKEIRQTLIDEAPQAMFAGDGRWLEFFKGLLALIMEWLPKLLAMI